MYKNTSGEWNTHNYLKYRSDKVIYMYKSFTIKNKLTKLSEFNINKKNAFKKNFNSISNHLNRIKKNILITSLLVIISGCNGNESNSSEKNSIYLQNQNSKKLVIVTLDGVRWQEIFRGADSNLLSKYGSEEGKELFWSENKDTRRKLLFDPDYFASIGSLYGNRDKGSQVNVKNPYRLSYPGYHEIFTSNIEEITSNATIDSPHESLLEFINKQPSYSEVTDVQAYGIWVIMRELFRVHESKLLLFTPAQIEYDQPGKHIDLMHWKDEKLLQNFDNKDINEFKVKYKSIIDTFKNLHKGLLPYGEHLLESEQAELLLYSLGKEFMKKTKPKVAYFQFGLSDKFGHQGKYDDYLKSIYNISVFLKDLINHIENDPFYAGKTSIFITTDHGRGEGEGWKDHGANAEHSDEIWFTLINPQEAPKGEVSNSKQYFQIQFAPTMAELLNISYDPEHSTADAMDF